RVEDDLDCLGVRPVIAICRIRHVAAGVPDAGRDHARLFPDQVLHPPEAPTGKHGPLGRRCRHLLAPSFGTVHNVPGCHRLPSRGRRDCRECCGMLSGDWAISAYESALVSQAVRSRADRAIVTVVPDATDATCIDTAGKSSVASGLPTTLSSRVAGDLGCSP